MAKKSQDVPVKQSEGTPATTTAHPIVGLRDEIDQLFDSFMRGWPGFGAGWDPFREMRLPAGFEGPQPSVDLTETEQSYEISAELPGIDPENIELTLRDDVLTLKGEKQDEREETRKNYYIKERSYGAFQRMLRLPDDVDPDKIQTRYANGVLTVTLPKSEQARSRTRKIEVKSD